MSCHFWGGCPVKWLCFCDIYNCFNQIDCWKRLVSIIVGIIARQRMPHIVVVTMPCWNRLASIIGYLLKIESNYQNRSKPVFLLQLPQHHDILWWLKNSKTVPQIRSLCWEHSSVFQVQLGEHPSYIIFQNKNLTFTPRHPARFSADDWGAESPFQHSI